MTRNAIVENKEHFSRLARRLAEIEVCQECFGAGGRWDDESIDQWYTCGTCAAKKAKEMNWDQIYFETYNEMDCNDLSSVVAGHRGYKPHQLRERAEKKQQVSAELDSFKRAVTYRPTTIEEAISRRQNEIVSSMPMIAGWIAWQLMKWLVIEVFKIAWKKYQEQQLELAAGKPS